MKKKKMLHVKSSVIVYERNFYSHVLSKLFTVPYFSVIIKSSRSSALRYGLPSCMSVKDTYGAGPV